MTKTTKEEKTLGKPYYYQKGKARGKGNYYGYQSKGYYNYRKSKGKGKGDALKGPPLPTGQYYNKGKGGKQSDIACYYCGKPGHTSDKCWWKGRVYNIDQAQPVWSLPDDNSAQQMH
eukprot:4048321-Amphidinium_carterae.2